MFFSQLHCIVHFENKEWLAGVGLEFKVISVGVCRYVSGRCAIVRGGDGHKIRGLRLTPHGGGNVAPHGGLDVSPIELPPWPDPLKESAMPLVPVPTRTRGLTRRAIDRAWTDACAGMRIDSVR